MIYPSLLYWQTLNLSEPLVYVYIKHWVLGSFFISGPVLWIVDAEDHSIVRTHVVA